MEKVKLTKRQAEILETELKSSHINGNKEKFVKKYLNLEGDDWQDGYPLTCLTGDTLIRALYIGYEIKKTEQEIMQEIWDSPLRDKSLFYYRQGISVALSIVGRKDLIPQDKS